MSPADGLAVAPALTCRDVTAGYTAIPVVRNIQVAVGAGTIVTVIGPNGSGKSTLLRAVAGHLPLQSGTVLLSGRDVSRLSPEQRAAQGMAYVPQNDDVFGTLTVAENLEVGGCMLGRRARAARIGEVLEAIPQLRGLRRRKALHLSGGERKLTALGRAMVARPGLLLLDEPTAGLAEPIALTILRETVTALRNAGVGILLVEQRARLALEVSDLAYVLVSGEVQYSGTAAGLLEGDRFTTMFFKAAEPGRQVAADRE
jgi:branched-chain amino acid transport system ATP-binding protein